MRILLTQLLLFREQFAQLVALGAQLLNGLILRFNLLPTLCGGRVQLGLTRFRPDGFSLGFFQSLSVTARLLLRGRDGVVPFG